jgi:hypothetical protein
MSITYSERVLVASGIQHAMRIRRIFHRWTVRLYTIFPYYLINGAILGEKNYLTKCVFSFSLQLLSETFLIR